MANDDNDVSADLLRRVTPAQPDPTSALRTVSQITLRTDLRRILAGCPLEQSGLRENLSTISEHARRHDIHAEQLLVLIKEACTVLSEGRELLTHPNRAGTLAELISMAVDEYYGPANTAL
ncbi:MAG: hypothetical protein ABI889_06380 [Gemmatimonadota bacterium]